MLVAMLLYGMVWYGVAICRVFKKRSRSVVGVEMCEGSCECGSNSLTFWLPATHRD